MTHDTIQIGNTQRLYTKSPFKDAIAGTPIDPTTVQLEVIGGGTTTTYTYGNEDGVVQKVVDSLGDYYADIVINASGRWLYTWIGSGNLVASDQEYFEVKARLTK